MEIHHVIKSTHLSAVVLSATLLAGCSWFGTRTDETAAGATPAPATTETAAPAAAPAPAKTEPAKTTRKKNEKPPFDPAYEK